MNDAVRQKFLPFALCAISLVLGVFCGVVGARSPRGRAVETEPSVTPTRKDTVADESTVKVLRARIRELEKRLAAQAKPSEEKKADDGKPAEEPRAEQGPRPPEGGPDRWIQEMKKNHPERYAAITNWMAQFRKMQTAQAQEKIGFLSSVDPSALGAEAKEVHERLQALIARREELAAQAQQGFEQMSGEDRREFFRQQGELSHEIDELNDKERSNLFRQMAKNLGFAEEDAGEIVETVNQIIEATEGGFGPSRRQMRAFGPPPGEGPRP